MKCKRCNSEMPSDWKNDFCFFCWVRGLDAGIDIQTEVED